MPYIVKSVTHAARGLRLPSHMGITSEGRVFVSEFGGGCIHEVTSLRGDQVSGKSLVLDSLVNPSGIHPLSDGTLIVADSGRGEIKEISLSRSSAAASVTTIASQHSNPYGVFEHQKELYTTFSNNRMAGISRIVKGRSFDKADIFVSNFPVVVQSEPYPHLAGCGGSWGGSGGGSGIFFSHYALGAIFDVTKGGTYEDFREQRFAWALTGPLGIIFDPIDGDLYVVEKGSGVIKRIEKQGGYSRFATPLIAGFQEPSCIRFLPDGSAAYVCDRAWGTVFRLELQHISA
ncbi:MULTISPECIES: hypothetical protein [Citrobacter]|uniref:hypothetical protein n=1 Tax=Citrobacter TaxID=544 RepID=UPI001F14D434|nr:MULTISPECIES: hypothetical protein [Citrobacter]MDM2834914.1 hypothetical protein [Citrobacter sp. Cpo091]DAE71461.1 MAG TPA: Glutaminyl Cyclase [Caudoviricetes sp.]HEI8931171.1 hypothetical protein [Citrobacter freundii]